MKHFVFIIESPDPSDLYEGRLEGQVLYNMLNLANVPVEYRLVTNREQFRRGLLEMGEQISSRQGLPLLHISAHGNKDSIALTDDTEIDWPQLRADLTGIAGKFGMMILCLSSCEGFEAWRSAEGTDGSPFFALIAPRRSVAWADSAVAFVTFYHLLGKSTGKTFGNMIETMRAASGEDSFDIIGATEVNAHYLKLLQSSVENLGTE